MKYSEILPDWQKYDGNEAYCKQLTTEYLQSMEEGKDIASYRSLFEAVDAMPDSPHKAAMADCLFRLVTDAPTRAGYPYDEPSDLAAIFEKSECRPGAVFDPQTTDFSDRLKGAWYGRICGCLLGKPVEGMPCTELTEFLRRSGNLPMGRYITQRDVPGNTEGLAFPIAQRAYCDGVMDGMPVDDDTNYIIMAFEVLRRCGRDFTPEDMMNLWLQLQSKNAYFTAERVAYRNFIDGYRPPVSAIYKNPYREWIGAQIRGDLFGWVNPGNPRKAAEMAWRDACISHIKNGIYGEMWVAAMLADAAADSDIKSVIRTGLSYIPTNSRLHEAVLNVVKAYESGVTPEAFFADLHTRWNDRNGHHWCHTISNAEIVAASLLWGGGDYGKTVCMAVEQGFDTDCNGATAGSVLGMLLGKSRIPALWTDKINGTLNTTLFGYERISVDEYAEKTLQFLG